MSKNLEMVVKKYLYDAGFLEEQYVVIDNKYIENFIEVFFIAEEKAIDYILSDIETSNYKNILEIKKYHHKDDIFSAIITYRN